MLISSSSEQKYFTIALTEDILFESVALVNKELFSSNILEFEVFGSQSFPQTEWIYLGDFSFENTRNWQVFTATPAWIRYIRINILSHYEEDKYISLTQIRVFGKTMLSEFKNDLNTDPTVPQFNLSFPREDVADAIKFNKYPKPNIPNQNRENKEFNEDSNGEQNNFNGNNQNSVFYHSSNCSNWCEIDYILTGIQCIHNSDGNQSHILNQLATLGPLEKPTRSNNSDSYQSVFKKLAKHIKILEENQKLLQKFIEAQEDLNDYLKNELKSVSNDLEGVKSLHTHLGNSLFYQTKEINKLRVSLSRVEDSFLDIQNENLFLHSAYKVSFIFLIFSLLVIVFVNKFRRKNKKLQIKKFLNNSFTSEGGKNKTTSNAFKLADELSLSEISASDLDSNLLNAIGNGVDKNYSNNRMSKTKSFTNIGKQPRQRRVSQPSKLQIFFDYLYKKPIKNNENNEKMDSPL